MGNLAVIETENDRLRASVREVLANAGGKNLRFVVVSGMDEDGRCHYAFSRGLDVHATIGHLEVVKGLLFTEHLCDLVRDD